MLNQLRGERDGNVGAITGHQLSCFEFAMDPWAAKRQRSVGTGSIPQASGHSRILLRRRRCRRHQRQSIDLVAGPFWYEGPEFVKASAFYEPVPQSR